MPNGLIGRDIGRMVGYVRGTRPGYGDLEIIQKKASKKESRRN